MHVVSLIVFMLKFKILKECIVIFLEIVFRWASIVVTTILIRTLQLPLTIHQIKATKIQCEF